MFKNFLIYVERCKNNIIWWLKYFYDSILTTEYYKVLILRIKFSKWAYNSININYLLALKVNWINLDQTIIIGCKIKMFWILLLVSWIKKVLWNLYLSNFLHWIWINETDSLIIIAYNCIIKKFNFRYHVINRIRFSF